MLKRDKQTPPAKTETKKKEISAEISSILVRMFILLKRLETEPCTVHRLAELMKISVRTVQRDMDLLQKSGFPIAMAPETNEFYLVSNYGVPVVQLSFPSRWR